MTEREPKGLRVFWPFKCRNEACNALGLCYASAEIAGQAKYKHGLDEVSWNNCCKASLSLAKEYKCPRQWGLKDLIKKATKFRDSP